MKAKIINTLLVRDEEDIVEENIKHHLANEVFGVIATDNGSKDKTRSILERHPGVLCLIDQPSHTFEQDVWVTKMCRLAHEMKADWVVNTDADEFFYGLETLKDIPEEITSIRVTQIRKYLPIGTSALFATRFNMKNFKYYSLPPTRGKTIFRASPNASVCLGNHRVKGLKGKKLYSDEIYIKHYPERGYDNFLKKCRNACSIKNAPYVSRRSPWLKLCELYENKGVMHYYDNYVGELEKELRAGLDNKTIFIDDEVS